MRKIAEKENALHTQANYRLVEALSASESRYRSLLEHLSEIVYALDEAHRITFINPAWNSHLGHRVADSLGKPIWEFVAEEHRERMQAMLATGAGFSRDEISFLHKDGSKVWIDCSVQPEKSAPGGGFAGTLININDRKLASLALQASEERYSLIACATNDGIWDWDLVTDSVYLSPRWKEQLGYADHELNNAFATWYERLHPDDSKQAMADIMDCLEGRTALYESFHRLLHRDGSYRWMFDRGVVMRDEKGQPYRMAGSHADVSSLHEAEEALVQRERELDTIFHISPDGIVTVTREGIISSVNPAFEFMTGFERKNIVGIREEKLQEMLLSVSEELPSGRAQPGAGLPDGRENTMRLDEKKMLAHPTRRRSDGERTVKLRKPNIRVIKMLSRQMLGQPIAKVVYFRDVTLETEVDRMKSEFLSTAAHELRTPMASIYGFSELLLVRSFPEEQVREIIKVIHDQSSSLVKMLNELLDLARIEAKTGRDFVFEEVDLTDVVERVIGGLMIPGDQRKVKLAKSTVEHALITADREKVAQALSNVLSNAYKYSRGGGQISLEIVQRYRSDAGRQIGVSVVDQGIGMTQEQQSHIFERFWRADTSGKIPGTGLGMSLVKEIMDIHQGEIEITSTVGLGTMVRLWFRQTN